MAFFEVLAILTFGILAPSLILLQLNMYKENNEMEFSDVGKIVGGSMGYIIVSYAFFTTCIGLLA